MIFILLVFSFIFSAYAALEPCDIVNRLKPDTKNCNQFYQCTNQGWAPLLCPSGLEFNPISLRCDWPENVTCAKDTEDKDNSKLEACNEVGQLKSDSKNCQKYYVCTENGWASHECQSPLLFNSISKSCDYYVYVTCAK